MTRTITAHMTHWLIFIFAMIVMASQILSIKSETKIIKKPEKVLILKNKFQKQNLYSHDDIIIHNINISGYHCNLAECPDTNCIGFSGDSCKKGTCGITIHLAFNTSDVRDSILINTGDANIDGWYTVNDIGNTDLRRGVDIWLPDTSKLKFMYYKQTIKIRKHGK